MRDGPRSDELAVRIAKAKAGKESRGIQGNDLSEGSGRAGNRTQVPCRCKKGEGGSCVSPALMEGNNLWGEAQSQTELHIMQPHGGGELFSGFQPCFVQAAHTEMGLDPDTGAASSLWLHCQGVGWTGICDMEANGNQETSAPLALSCCQSGRAVPLSLGASPMADLEGRLLHMLGWEGGREPA